MDLSIIVVNYNTLRLTSNCINSIFANTKGISFEVIVVDNNSKDGSKEYLSSDRRIIFVESGDNIGFGRANNIGYSKSSGRYLLMLNSDTVLENNILYKMVERFDQLPEDVACLGSLLVHGDKKPSCSFGYFVRWQNEFVKNTKKKDVTCFDGEEQEVDFVSGADLFVRREVADRLGLFDPDFFMYYEDMELGFRYGQNNYRSIVVNEHGIVHLEGASLNNNFRKITIITKSYLTYLRKTLGFSEFALAKFLIVARRSFTAWHYRWPVNDTIRYILMMIKA